MDRVETYGQVAETLLEYVETNRTDQVDDLLRVPARDYLDRERFEREMALIFRRVPLMLALTIELQAAHDYKAMDVIGLPILLTRGKDGKARAFLNVCAHRAMQLVPDGTGNCSRFSCPYHGWTYRNDGRLMAVADAGKFGVLDRATHGLTELPCEEQAGMIFAILTPGQPIDVAQFLGGMLDDLAGLELHKWHYLHRREIFGANWKVTYDGYIEGYHFAAAHPKTVLPRTYSNIMKYDFFGPHMRMALPQTRIGELRSLPREDWGRRENYGYDFTRTIFPNISIFLAPEMGQIAQLLPGPGPAENRTVLNYICRERPADEASRVRVEEMCKFFGDVTYEEDYLLGLQVQKGLQSGAREFVTFGRNELGNQHFHKSIDEYLTLDAHNR
jgi:nitrite reductase/ring-hydroxylating ferredoxin subunit